MDEVLNVLCSSTYMVSCKNVFEDYERLKSI